MDLSILSALEKAVPLEGKSYLLTTLTNSTSFRSRYGTDTGENNL